MLISRRLPALLTTAAVFAFAPAAPALAQSAGDEQYADPLGESTTQGSTPKPKPTTPAPAPTATATVPATPAPAPSGDAGEVAATSTATTASPGTVAGEEELARTGANPWKLGLVGLVLFALGIGLRARTADARR